MGDNPFDQPLASEVHESSQRQVASQQASPNGNPFDEPLASEVAEQKEKSRNDGAQIQPVTTSTNPKLNIAASGEKMPEYVGAVGSAGAGLMGAGLLTEASAPVLKHIATEYGAPALQALKVAAESHPIVAKLLGHALGTVADLSLVKYMNLFGKK